LFICIVHGVSKSTAYTNEQRHQILSMSSSPRCFANHYFCFRVPFIENLIPFLQPEPWFSNYWASSMVFLFLFLLNSTIFSPITLLRSASIGLNIDIRVRSMLQQNVSIRSSASFRAMRSFPFPFSSRQSLLQ
jgi:hypothetical protein